MSSQSIPHVIDTRVHTVLPRTMLLVLTDQVPSLSLTIVFPVSLINICRYLIPTITTVLLSSVNSYTWIPVVSFWFLLCRITPLFRPFLMTSLITVMLSSQLPKVMQKVKSLWETKSGNHIIAVQMDDTKEFCCGHLKTHLTSHGIIMQVTASYTHSQNGKVEHLIWTFQTLLYRTVWWQHNT